LDSADESGFPSPFLSTLLASCSNSAGSMLIRMRGQALGNMDVTALSAHNRNRSLSDRSRMASDTSRTNTNRCVKILQQDTVLFIGGSNNAVGLNLSVSFFFYLWRHCLISAPSIDICRYY
jgi:hypothetical protein